MDEKACPARDDSRSFLPTTIIGGLLIHSTPCSRISLSQCLLCGCRKPYALNSSVCDEENPLKSLGVVKHTYCGFVSGQHKVHTGTHSQNNSSTIHRSLYLHVLYSAGCSIRDQYRELDSIPGQAHLKEADQIKIHNRIDWANKKGNYKKRGRALMVGESTAGVHRQT